MKKNFTAILQILDVFFFNYFNHFCYDFMFKFCLFKQLFYKFLEIIDILIFEDQLSQ